MFVPTNRLSAYQWPLHNHRHLTRSNASMTCQRTPYFRMSFSPALSVAFLSWFSESPLFSFPNFYVVGGIQLSPSPLLYLPLQFYLNHMYHCSYNVNQKVFIRLFSTALNSSFWSLSRIVILLLFAIPHSIDSDRLNHTKFISRCPPRCRSITTRV